MTDLKVHNDFQLSWNFRQSSVDGMKSLIELINSKNEQGHVYIQYSHEISEDESGSIQRVTNVIRSLKPTEIKVLSTECMCHCADWSKVYLMYNGDELDENSILLCLKDQVLKNYFQGCIVLGLYSNTMQQKLGDVEHSLCQSLKPAIYNNTLIMDSVIVPGARVYGNTMVSKSFIGPNSSVINCNSISVGKNWSDVMEITLGPESGGGRPVKVKPESTLVEVCDLLGISSNGLTDQNSEKAVPNELQFNCILGHLQSVHVGTSLFISESASIESCPSVHGAIMLPQSKIKNSTIESTFLQWKSSIQDSTVSSTLLMECSDIGPKSVVASTIIGPDSHVSCGEVHCSLIGPNTNSHHQSLLISVLWPMGRGNVGYGSNIGSNHTGRLPDQECTTGEGIFYGLGCLVKFPVDLSHAYYSVIAAGVQLPPQSVSMPFSLIMNGTSGDNEIVPGWLLQSSPYTVLRSENKFEKRRKAIRHDFYTGWKIIRPSVIDACWDARRSLLQLNDGDMQSAKNATATIYSRSDISEIGENIMTVRGRNVGIDAYTKTIQRYALHGLFEEMNRIIRSDDTFGEEIENICTLWQPKHFDFTKNSTMKSWPIMPWKDESYDNKEKTLKHQLSTLGREIPALIGLHVSSMTQIQILQTLVQKTIALEVDFLRRVKKSKMRDDQRGSAINPQYKDSHVLASDDPVVKMAEDDTKKLVKRCNDILAKLDSFVGRSMNTPHSKL